MSADNGYVIRKHPDGGYAAVHYFMSEYLDTYVYPEVGKYDVQYATIDEAIGAVVYDYSEYGVAYDEDVWLEAYPEEEK